jgi:tetratricopeptide (TPR) repeat protein
VHAIRSAPQELAVRALPTLAYQREWGEAARIAYQAEADRTLSPLDETLAVAAVRMHARKSGEYRRAIELFERLAGVTWDEQGEPHLSTHLATMVSVVALADMLQQQGDAGRARRLAQASLTEATHVIRDLQRGDFWYLKFRAQTMMLLGDHQGALQALEDAAGQGPGMGDWWFVLEIEPLLVPLHDEPRFKRLLTAIRNRAAVERESLEALRRAGTVPIRKAD